MKLSISITTYNRTKILLNQLKELESQLTSLNWDAEILVINDASLHKYTKVEDYLSQMPFKTKYERYNINQGKRKHWRIVNRAFSWHRRNEFDFVLYLQDDCELNPDFLKNLVNQFQSIDHDQKVCLNYVLEQSRIGKPVWTPVHPRVYKFGKLKMYRVGWVDLHFLANRKFFETLNWYIYPISQTRWEQDPKLSSGVGRQISFRLFRDKKAMWQVMESLVKHGHHKSWMNPNARKENPNFKSI